MFADKLIQRRHTGIEAEDIRTAVQEVFQRVKGAYSVVGTVSSHGMYAFRDPWGIKPIIYGRRETPEGTFHAVASESVVLDVAGYEVVRDLKAGEALWIDSDRNLHWMDVGDQEHRPCIFEHIYFARPDSTLDDVSVYNARAILGRKLADAWRETGREGDAVIPVPESARTAAQTMAEALEIPYREGFVKNRYVGRTFIMPKDEDRRETIRHKLNPIRSEFEGKRVLIVDDSIVRGNTSRQLVLIARQMGAEKVYLASYSPPLLHPCYYGIDMSTKREFVAQGRTIPEVAEELGADHLVFQTIVDMVAGVREAGAPDREFCKACFTGDYPTKDITPEMADAIVADRIAAS